MNDKPKVNKPFWIGFRVVGNLVFLAGLVMAYQKQPHGWWMMGAGFVLIVYSWLRPKM